MAGAESKAGAPSVHIAPTRVPGPRGTTSVPLRLETGACGMLHAPGAEGDGPIGIVCPPIFYEHQLCHRTLRALAERLAASGARVLRLDYRGIGDAPSIEGETGPTLWREDVSHAAAALEDLCGRRPSFYLGLRAGAAVALDRAAAETAPHGQAPSVYAWSPVVDGPAYAKELAAAHAHWFADYASGHRRSADLSSRSDRVLGQPWSAASRRDLESLAPPPSGALRGAVTLIETDGHELSPDERRALEASAPQTEVLAVPGPAPWRQPTDTVSPAVPAKALEAISKRFAEATAS